MSEIAMHVPEDADFDQLALFVRDHTDLVASSAELEEDGFTFLENKDQLVDSEFIITGIKWINSTQYGEGVIVKLVTRATNSKVKIADFSTGIKEQLKSLPQDKVAIYCKNGLVRSDYPANEFRPAGTTYYLDTSGGTLPAGKL